MNLVARKDCGLYFHEVVVPTFIVGLRFPVNFASRSLVWWQVLIPSVGSVGHAAGPFGKQLCKGQGKGASLRSLVLKEYILVTGAGTAQSSLNL